MLKPIFILLLNAIIGSCITTKNGATTLKPAVTVKSTVPTTVRATTTMKTTSTRKIVTTTKKATSTMKTTFKSTTTTTTRSTSTTTMKSSTIASKGYEYAIIMGHPVFNNILETVEIWYPGTPPSCIIPNIPSMPDNRDVMPAALLGNMIMYCGGWVNTGLTGYVTKTCYSYTLGSNSASWVSAPSMVHNRQDHSMTAVNGMIVVAGGQDLVYNTLSSVEVFKNGNWQDKLGWKMTTPRSGHCAAKYGGNTLIVTGGILQNGIIIINTVEKLDTVTGKWTMVNSLNSARWKHSCVSYSKGATEYVVVAGGIQTSGQTNSVELFSSDTNVWVQLPSMNSARAQHSMGILDGYLTVIGGAYGAYDETEYLDGNFWRKGKKLQKGRPYNAMVQITCI